jgi:hypothetical protein
MFNILKMCDDMKFERQESELLGNGEGRGWPESEIHTWMMKGGNIRSLKDLCVL